MSTFRIHVTCVGALSASSTTRTWPNWTAFTNGESSYFTIPSTIIGCMVNDCTVVSLESIRVVILDGFFLLRTLFRQMIGANHNKTPEFLKMFLSREYPLFAEITYASSGLTKLFSDFLNF